MSPRRSLLSRIVPLMLACAALAACEREERVLRIDPPVAEALADVEPMPNGIGGSHPEVYAVLGAPYETNAYDLSQGKRLYSWFGCKSCHGDGSGGAGPSLLDGWWRYGSDIESIFLTIRDGRPHGMPAFRDKLTTEQVWQLAGYVQTIGAYSAKTAAPGRDDDKQTRPAENRAPAALLMERRGKP